MTTRALIGGGTLDRTVEQLGLHKRPGAIRVQAMAAGRNRADLHTLETSYAASAQGQVRFAAGMEITEVAGTSSPLAPRLPAVTRAVRIFDLIKVAATGLDCGDPIRQVNAALISGGAAAGAETFEALR